MCAFLMNSVRLYTLYIVSFYILFAVQAGNLEYEADRLFPHTPVLVDAFLEYTAKPVYAAALPYLNEIGADPDELSRLPVPKNWYIEWGSYPLECVISGDENGFRIKSPSAVFKMHGPQLEMFNYEYLIEFDFINLGESKAIVDLGVHDYGMMNPGPHVISKIDLPPGETQTSGFRVSLMDGYTVFVPMVGVQGDVQIKNMRVYRREIEGVTVVEGEISERSELPDPGKSDYPDCRYTAHFIGNSILAGEMCRRELGLVIDGFRDYKLLNTDKVASGDKVTVVIIPFDKLPVALQSTQQADELSLFTLDNYFVTSISKIDQYKDSATYSSSGILFADTFAEYVSIFDRRINPPVPAALVSAQNEAVAADLAKMNQLVDGFEAKRESLNLRFNESWEKEKANDPPDYNRVGKYIWRNIDGSFWALPEHYIFAPPVLSISAPKLEALISLKKMLEANGVQLIISIVPNPYTIAARVMNPSFRDVPDYQLAKIVRQLSNSGLETIYAADELIANYNRYPFAFFYPNDTHPSDTCQDVLVEIMAKRLNRYNLPETLERELFSFGQSSHIFGRSPAFQFPVRCNIGSNLPGTSYTNRQVLYDGKRLQENRQSPVMILGNSFIASPISSPDSYPTLLASKIAHMPWSYRISSYGPMTTIIQNLFATPEKFLKDRRVVILQFGMDYFFAPINWNDLSVMDDMLKMMVGKSLIAVHEVVGEDIQDSIREGNLKNALEIWNSLENKKEFFISASQNVEITGINIDSADSGKNIVCAVAVACSPFGRATVIVNGKKENMPSYYGTIFWRNLMFELPAGTKSIRVSATGAPNTIFAIRNIAIYQ